jgi:hypothetical protein
MKNMAKKSQFYVLTAVLLIIASFMIVANNNAIRVKTSDVSKGFLENYMYESTIVMNNAFYYNSNVSEALRNYTESFIDYAQKKNQKLGIAFLFSEDEQIHIVNYLKEPVLIISSGETINFEAEKVFQYANEVELKYQNISYYFYFSEPNKKEFKAMLVKQNN